jgi:hypothetical protein
MTNPTVLACLILMSKLKPFIYNLDSSNMVEENFLNGAISTSKRANQQRGMSNNPQIQPLDP